MDNRPIGVFDSGVGGLTVLKAVKHKLPHEDIIYLGDTARVPYGNKSRDTVIRFSTQNSLFLLKSNVKAIVVACNTASALALDYLEKYFKVPIIGVIAPGVDKAVSITKGRIGVIATKATIKSKSYRRAILMYNADWKVYSKACPLFVPLVEEGMVTGEITTDIIKMYLAGLKRNKVDTLILGCTHYPMLKEAIGLYLSEAKIVDSGDETAIFLGRLLRDRKMQADVTRKGKITFYVTDDARGFFVSAARFLNEEIQLPLEVKI